MPESLGNEGSASTVSAFHHAGSPIVLLSRIPIPSVQPAEKTSHAFDDEGHVAIRKKAGDARECNYLVQRGEESRDDTTKNT